jgi:hypothetical protein
MKKKILFNSLFVFLSFSAMATQPSFNYIEGGYTTYSSSDDEDNTEDGLSLNGKFEIDSSFFVVADFNYLSKDNNSIDSFDKMSKKTYSLGLGYKMIVNAQTALFTHIDYIQYNGKTEEKANKTSSAIKSILRGSAYKVGVGIKSRVTDVIELSSELSYANYGTMKIKVENEYIQGFKNTYKQLNIALNYKIMDPLSLYLSAQRDFGFSNDDNNDFDSTKYTFGLRYSF